MSNDSQALSAEAVQIQYLMEVGWVLHLSDNSTEKPKLFKSTVKGRTTHVEELDITHDAVIDLQNAGMMKVKKRFRFNNNLITVYESKNTRK